MTQERQRPHEPYRSLIVWRQAHELTIRVYRLTDAFPDHERFGIVSQLRRAAASIPTNIVEGYARRGNKDCLRFLDISRASLLEGAYLLELAKDLGYLSDDLYKDIDDLRGKTGFLLRKFIIGIKTRSQNPNHPNHPNSPNRPNRPNRPNSPPL